MPYHVSWSPSLTVYYPNEEASQSMFLSTLKLLFRNHSDLVTTVFFNEPEVIVPVSFNLLINSLLSRLVCTYAQLARAQ